MTKDEESLKNVVGFHNGEEERYSRYISPTGYLRYPTESFKSLSR